MAGIQFRKRKKLLPGVNLNVSKKGLGISVGPKGAKISRSATGRVTGSVGVPGSGLSYRKTLRGSPKGDQDLSSNIDSRTFINRFEYIATHGPVLTKKETRRALIPMSVMFLLSGTFPFVFLRFPKMWLLLLVIWLIFAVDYLRQSSINKRKWNMRVEEHLKVCEHDVGESE